MEHESTDPQNTTVLGFKTRTWATIISICVAVIFTVFILLPFVLALVVPLFQKQTAHLVSFLDSIALIVGVTGTVASIASIFMTIADKKRYNQEKEQMQGLIRSVDSLHSEVGAVADYVIKTFEQNARLGLALYEKKVIDNNPNLVDISTNASAHASPSWKGSGTAGELPPSQ